MKRLILAVVVMILVSPVWGQDVNSEIVRISNGIVESGFAREVISNMVTYIAYQEADSWTGYALSGASNVVDAAVDKVAQYRDEQESVGYINYYVTSWGSGGVIATDTNATVRALKIDVTEQPTGSMIELYYHFVDDVKTEQNRIQFTESIGIDSNWEDINIIDSYETNIVVNGETKTAMYFKLFSETSSGFFRFSAQLKSIDIGESLHIVEGLTIDNVRGLTCTIYAETDDPATTNKVELKDGLFMGGTIHRARLLQDDTAHDLGGESDGGETGLAKMTLSQGLEAANWNSPPTRKADTSGAAVRDFLNQKYELEARGD